MAKKIRKPGSADWADASYWEPSGVPGAGDDVYFYDNITDHITNGIAIGAASGASAGDWGSLNFIGFRGKIGTPALPLVGDDIGIVRVDTDAGIINLSATAISELRVSRGHPEPGSLMILGGEIAKAYIFGFGGVEFASGVEIVEAFSGLGCSVHLNTGVVLGSWKHGRGSIDCFSAIETLQIAGEGSLWRQRRLLGEADAGISTLAEVLAKAKLYFYIEESVLVEKLIVSGRDSVANFSKSREVEINYAEAYDEALINDDNGAHSIAFNNTPIVAGGARIIVAQAEVRTGGLGWGG